MSTSKIVTFDFDDTLTHTFATWGEDGCLEDTHLLGANHEIIQCLLDCVQKGHKVMVVTSRSIKWEKDTLDLLSKFGVLHLLEGVHHTNGEWKATWMLENGLNPIKHFDDDQEELDEIEKVFPNCHTVKISLHESWQRTTLTPLNSNG